ncbi:MULTISPECIES: endonuclease V [unclassified Arcicella]|uniref:endonuclease V n=1 Tax=unclassified Arcicella TaxID=2644986 RepID=UPI002865A0AF|nr:MULTISPECIES: endonuclease V [unclassified Arcicella]MDR6565010.1 exodeoxyribonuclease-5/deoxyribonuclease V [Arcicella sp. BE51]MDR6814811.1 exodeoxyribonuclease-5/deoxyribonuclease V [Arcicella sp. BE140]MDR6826257.1 exodeoxyribonuclease-5/deoxyribonuclease V [Arcicella sp. BE139]
MILCFDTYYFDNKAKTVCIAFESWENDENYQVTTEILEGIEEYQSGEFYKRELPCIMSLLEKIQIENIETIIVDSFVFLDDNQKLGLGGHLYRELGSTIPIIGVAKTNFATIEQNKRQLLRGTSIKPLYITAIGIDLDKATELIKNMSGPNRIPTLLKTLDTLTKE